MTMEGSPPTDPADIHTGRRPFPLLPPSDGRDGMSGSWGSEGRPCSAPELVEVPTGASGDDSGVIPVDTASASLIAVLLGVAAEGREAG